MEQQPNRRFRTISHATARSLLFDRSLLVDAPRESPAEDARIFVRAPMETDADGSVDESAETFKSWRVANGQLMELQHALARAVASDVARKSSATVKLLAEVELARERATLLFEAARALRPDRLPRS
jgi:hypothetical protein